MNDNTDLENWERFDLIEERVEKIEATLEEIIKFLRNDKSILDEAD